MAIKSRPKNSADQIVHDQLEILGEKVYTYAKKNSRVSKTHTNSKGLYHKGGTLRDSINYDVRGTTLRVGQVYYGKFQSPNELEVGLNKYLPATTEAIVSEITEWLNPFKDK